MVDTIHQVPSRPRQDGATPLTTVDLGVATLAERPVPREVRVRRLLRRLGLGLAVLAASFAASLPLWHWAMTSGARGDRYTLATSIVIAAVVVVFVVPELVLAVRAMRSRAARRHGDSPPSLQA